ncbi:GNAT family N-acetyltransferase [Ureibacillus acetophenoni]|uniref:RimJ/RimL family protein N-acetyltransferase n=1 Tax=Ureibacillus acetophenoni TaxID=614649 RepID=A0A285US57_9BACL|nr:GNAT family N-acetyltransferase [Ureibacillus acetophenoni]SOC44228.1 RimJ/RimL family protein N-acetyltransferase [Ureibacillus acetophenoni]
MIVITETERLILKVFENSDVEAMKTFWGDREVMEQCNGAIPHEHLVKVQEGYSKCHDVNGLSVYAVVEKESGNVVGAAGFNVQDINEPVELIYHFAKSVWGKGYATESAMACVKYAEQHPKVKKVFASADPNNKGSLKILEKIGFDYIGMKWFDDTNQEEPYYEKSIK